MNPQVTTPPPPPETPPPPQAAPAAPPPEPSGGAGSQAAERAFQTLRLWRRLWVRMSLRVRITGAFVLIVVGGTAVSTLIGSQIVTAGMLAQARRQTASGVEAARTITTDRLGALRRAVGRAGDAFAHSAPGVTDEAVARALDAVKAEVGADFLAVALPDGRVARAAGLPRGALARGGALEGLVLQARGGAAVGSIEVLEEEELAGEDPAVARRARVPMRSGEPDLVRGLVLLAAAPAGNGEIVYGGVLLNQQEQLVDRIRQLAFGSEQYRGRTIGTVTYFLGDVRIATNVRTRAGERAVGTHAAPDVARTVLAGWTWHDRAFVVDDWYVAGYEPLRDRTGRVVGMLYAGMLEAPFLAARTEIMFTFLWVTLAGLLVVLGLTWTITKTLIHPLEVMVEATKKIAEGDLSHRLHVETYDEIYTLAKSFNHMVESLQAARAELWESARTLEQKVEERTRELRAMQSGMVQSEKLASIGRLAAGVAHEINNPLGGILSLSMLAQEDMDPSHPLHADLTTIVKQTLRCREIVKGLLDFSRQSESRATRTDVNPVIESTLSLLGRQAMFQNIHREVALREGLPSVYIDPGQLQAVVMNIAINAADAMDESGVLTVRTDLDEAKGEVVLSIGDTGKGIPEEVLPLIFEPFFTTKKVGEGTGLGLAIVHGTVTRAGGRIDVQTSPRGTTFTVHLPVAGAESQAESDGAEWPVGPG